MKVDPELMFECLIYINAFYYPVFASSEFVMVIAKYESITRVTPNIVQDGAVCFSRLIVELLKILVFYRWKERQRSEYRPLWQSNFGNCLWFFRHRDSFCPSDDFSDFSHRGLHFYTARSGPETGKSARFPNPYVDRNRNCVRHFVLFSLFQKS